MTSSRAEWTYSNQWRMIAAFLGGSMILLGAGLLAVSSAGADAAFGAGVLLAVAVFLVAFAMLLFFPRLRRQGSFTFRTVFLGSVAEAEAAVRSALSASGRAVHAEDAASRSRHPPRVVRADGLPSRFLVQALSTREGGDGLERAEVIQIGLEDADDPAAREARDLVGSRLGASSDRAE